MTAESNAARSCADEARDLLTRLWSHVDDGDDPSMMVLEAIRLLAVAVTVLADASDAHDPIQYTPTVLPSSAVPVSHDVLFGKEPTR